MAGLPDPETRRFLLAGSVERVQAALFPHIALGLTLSFAEDGSTFTIGSPDGNAEVTLPTNQQLKLTVRQANTIMGEPQ